MAQYVFRAGKGVLLWRDFDTWGLSILSDVRARGVQVDPLMMDVQTVLDHEQRGSGDSILNSCFK